MGIVSGIQVWVSLSGKHWLLTVHFFLTHPCLASLVLRPFPAYPLAALSVSAQRWPGGCVSFCGCLKVLS